MKENQKKYDIKEFSNQCRANLVNYLCYICTGVYDNPVIDNCAHLYCKDCITEALKQNKNICPISGLIVDTLTEVKTVSSYLSDQIIHCKNQKLGCSFQCKLRNLEEHLKDYCDFSITTCPNRGCKEQFTRGELKTHLSFCPKRLETCEYCLEEIANYEITNHYYSICKKYKIPCDNDCGSLVERGEMELHKLTYCPFESVSCVYAKVGCIENPKRIELESHLINQANFHNYLLLNSYNNLEKNILTSMSQNFNKKLNTVFSAVLSKYRDNDNISYYYNKLLNNNVINNDHNVSFSNSTSHNYVIVKDVFNEIVKSIKEQDNKENDNKSSNNSNDSNDNINIYNINSLNSNSESEKTIYNKETKEIVKKEIKQSINNINEYKEKENSDSTDNIISNISNSFNKTKHEDQKIIELENILDEGKLVY